MFDHSTWDYKSLQKLCKTLGVKQTGTREKIIARLQQFHKEHPTSERFGAGAFANIGVQVYSSPTKTKPRVSRKFLSPMVNRSRGNSILKPQTPGSRRQAKRICFSPYNQVHIIPHRLDLKSPVRAMDLDDDL